MELPEDEQPGDPCATFREIGKGTFGIIFVDPSKPSHVIKRTLIPNVDPRGWLTQDAHWHERIYTSFEGLRWGGALVGETIRLPCVPKFDQMNYGDDNAWLMEHALAGRQISWADASGRHEETRYLEPSPILCAQQIPSAPSAVAIHILQEFHSDLGEEAIRSAVAMPTNRNALLRVYFGKGYDADHVSNSKLTSDALDSGPVTTSQRQKLKVLPSLRNFPLSQSRLAKVLSQKDYRTALSLLASAYAVLHWHVNCDARDVEFVLGGPDICADQVQQSILEITGERLQMWLLDFNQVTSISLTEEGVQKLVAGFLENDPYVPKPNRGSGEDWRLFKEEYLRVSQILLSRAPPHEENSEVGLSRDRGTGGENILRLPQLFISEVEKRQGLNSYQRLLGSSGTVTDDQAMDLLRSFRNVLRHAVSVLWRQ